MADRRRIVAGNWKMNGLRADGVARAGALAERARALPDGLACELVLCPPATLLAAVHAVLAGSSIALGGQDCHAEPHGAYTGDISAEMLADAGCTHVILGHSERRRLHGETPAAVGAKFIAAERAGLVPIVCIGETLAEREAGNAIDTVLRQLSLSLPTAAVLDRLVVAYEPVWAIGTGRTATDADIVSMHRALRACIPEAAPILYGGSVNAKNAVQILGLDDVDGALVGGASLVADEFWTIARCCG